MARPRRVRVVVLAAGAGRRFGGAKQLAELEGRPLLQHVLDTLAGAGVVDPIVVLGNDRETIRRRIRWRAADLVDNDDPDRGLATSVAIGWAAALRSDTAGDEAGDGASAGPADAVLFVLGDQPRLQATVVRTILAADLDAGRPIVAAHYAAGGGRNPVRIERSAAHLLAEIEGDRGLGPLIEGHPELVRSIDAPGTNPDVDRLEDLRSLAAAGLGSHASSAPTTDASKGP